ncbi:MAG: short-chain dehydrogenase, partial [Planktotalea sp.]
MRATDIEVVLIEPGPITSDIRRNSIPHFERWIDWKASARRAEYESGLLDRLYQSSGPDTFELPASAVTEKLRHACESARPKPRYYVTKATYIMGALRRILSTRLLDKVISKG